MYLLFLATLNNEVIHVLASILRVKIMNLCLITYRNLLAAYLLGFFILPLGVYFLREN